MKRFFWIMICFGWIFTNNFFFSAKPSERPKFLLTKDILIQNLEKKDWKPSIGTFVDFCNEKKKDKGEIVFVKNDTDQSRAINVSLPLKSADGCCPSCGQSIGSIKEEFEKEYTFKGIKPEIEFSWYTNL